MGIENVLELAEGLCAPTRLVGGRSATWPLPAGLRRTSRVLRCCGAMQRPLSHLPSCASQCLARWHGGWGTSPLLSPLWRMCLMEAGLPLSPCMQGHARCAAVPHLPQPGERQARAGADAQHSAGAALAALAQACAHSAPGPEAAEHLCRQDPGGAAGGSFAKHAAGKARHFASTRQRSVAESRGSFAPMSRAARLKLRHRSSCFANPGALAP
jgi:hypothetical protein